MGVRAYDSCWVYAYKHDWSSFPYQRTFSCPCGCCGSAWDRECCPSVPVCHHNSTIPEDNRFDEGQEQDDGTDQALMLAGIIVGTFCILLALTALTHMCGRIFMRTKPEAAPSVVVYNVQEPPRSTELKIDRRSTSGHEKTSMENPPPYNSATTTV